MSMGMSMRHGRASSVLRSLLMTLCAACLAGSAQAQAPSPLAPTLFAFPGSFEQPPSAASAGLAMADQWLGDSPFSNPAALGPSGVIVSPVIVRNSRQDLRAANHEYDERSAFFDGAGVSLALPGVPVRLYATQPVLRSEDFAFTRGTVRDPVAQPAVVSGSADMRESRTGIASSFHVSKLRLGAAVEWGRRDDRYDTEEQSGAPDQGTRHVDFAGEGVGGIVGFRYGSADTIAGAWTFGGALRYLPELKLEGTQQLDLLTGSSETPVAATREAAWEGGMAARYAVTPAFRVLASIGGRSQQDWKGFDLTAGPAVAARLAIEYHDSRDPWTLRMGLGEERERHVPEPRAGSVGLGLGYDFDGMIAEIGVLHRGIERSGLPRSYDDRVVGSLRVAF